MISTPQAIDKEILEFCDSLNSGVEPIFIKITPLKGCVPGDCYGNVERHIKKQGGKIQYGWIIWRDPKVLIEAEFHAVWINNVGKYIDITPTGDGENEILFLPDNKKVFSGKLIDNVRKPLLDDAYIRTSIKVSKKKFEIMCKYYTGHPMIEIPEFEIKNLENYRSITLQSEIKKDKIMSKMKIGRNELCPCGSGKKYKRCCIKSKGSHKANKPNKF